VPITKPKQRQQLMGEVYKDMTTRYMATTGKAVSANDCGMIERLIGGSSQQDSYITHTHLQQKASGGKSALLVAKDGGRVVGCAGIETRVVRDGQVTKMETLKAEVRCMGGWIHAWVDRQMVVYEMAH
jgi:hypothetical protein